MLVRRSTGLDLRRIGSGNVGAANALRSTRWRTGIAVALLDLAKGTAAVTLVAIGGGDTAARAVGGVAAVAGHVFPVWLRFRGGKGVATTCGVFACLAPLPTILAAAVFAIVVVRSRLVSLASLAGTGVLPVMSWALGSPAAIVVAAVASATIVGSCHWRNVERLARGTERRLRP
jgi:glycerol-3-phosphate acyltransferase PlsY